MSTESAQTDERKALRRAFIVSLIARTNPLLVLRSYNSSGEGPAVLSLLTYARMTSEWLTDSDSIATINRIGLNLVSSPVIVSACTPSFTASRIWNTAREEGVGVIGWKAD